MERKTLDHFRDLLEQERRRYQSMDDELRERGMGVSEGESISELSIYDNHPADIGTETFEREKDLGLMNHAQMMLTYIDEAFDRMESGLYGWCERCGRPIDGERLEAVPYASLCVHCKKGLESRGDTNMRPAEEDAIGAPFDRSFTDGSGDPGFDGEDTWQAVAHYGTSNTPQDVIGAVTYEDMTSDIDVDSGAVEPEERLVDSFHDVLLDEERKIDEPETFREP
ncbi:MAG: TraR/DksA C4-type zinc finger protein [Symbiobacteriia bacterium]